MDLKNFYFDDRETIEISSNTIHSLIFENIEVLVAKRLYFKKILSSELLKLPRTVEIVDLLRQNKLQIEISRLKLLKFLKRQA